eukprot:scaffold878_cov89-Cylindrotheca_fusiformis.AAC.3
MSKEMARKIGHTANLLMSDRDHLTSAKLETSVMAASSTSGCKCKSQKRTFKRTSVDSLTQPSETVFTNEPHGQGGKKDWHR